MSEVSTVKQFEIEVIRIERIAARAGYSEDPVVWVTFGLSFEEIRAEFPVGVNPLVVDDADLVKVARGVLHRNFMTLAAQTRSWAVPPAETAAPSSVPR